MERPYVLLSCAMSIDGYIDDASAQRLVLSGPADLDRVDEVRAGCDAILVGAATIRADDPRLVLRSQARRDARVARGLGADPVKVTVTTAGRLDPAARFFTTGEALKIVYAARPVAAGLQASLGEAAVVVDTAEPADLDVLLADLAGRGIGRLMVEGGSSVLAQFLAADLADELQLAIAPLFVGDPRAPRFAGGATLARPARLADVRQVGKDALLRYALSDRFDVPLT